MYGPYSSLMKKLPSRARTMASESIAICPCGVRSGWPDRAEHASLRREPIDVWAVFVADEKAAVASPHDGLGIDRDMSVRRPIWVAGSRRACVLAARTDRCMGRIRR